MQDDSVDLWATDEVHFQQHGSRCRMWIPPEIKDPVLLHAPTRKSVGHFGAVLAGWALCVPSGNRQIQWAQLPAVSSATPFRQPRQPQTGCGHRRQRPFIPTPACTDGGGNTTPITLPWTSFPAPACGFGR
jgi:hypothetical protein